MRKFCSNWAGFTTKTAPTSRIRISLSSISQRVSKPVSLRAIFGYITSKLITFVLDPSDAQSWYLLGRAYMAGQKYNKAYEAYQQAVYRDGRNPTFWCSIGVLYFQINQFRDALDAYSRAIRINPYIPEVWFDLGSLYESCNNQISDAIDAYARAAELDQSNRAISERLQMLKHSQATGAQLPAAPPPQDVHPTAYASAVIPPPGLAGPPLMLHSGNGPRPMLRADSRGPGESSMVMPPPPQSVPGRMSPAPFRGGPPPPVVLDESRRGALHTPLAPMDVDHIPPHVREPNGAYTPAPIGRDGHPRSHINMLLHHSGPPVHEQDPRGPPPPHPHDVHYGRSSRAPSRPPSPPSHHGVRPHSPGASPYQGYAHGVRPPPGQGPPSGHPRSPHMYGREVMNNGHHPERDSSWERREWDRGRVRPGSEYPGHPAQHTPYYPPRAISPPRRVPSPPVRGRDPVEPSHMARPPSRQAYYENRGGMHPPPSPPIPVSQESMSGHRQYGEPSDPRGMGRGAPPYVGSSRPSESPHLSQRESSVAPDSRRRANGRKDKEVELTPAPTQPLPEPAKKERKKRSTANRRGGREESVRAETPKPSYPGDRGQGPQQLPPFKVSYSKPNESPEPTSSNGSSSNHRSVAPSPINPIVTGPQRVVDEDYDEGVAETLVHLSQAPVGMTGPAVSGAQRRASPTPSMASHHSHRNSISSTRSQHTPPSAGSKRPLSPASDETESKRSRMEAPSSTRGRNSPPPSQSTMSRSSRPSPSSYGMQPSSRSPENRQMERSQPSYSSSPQQLPQLPNVLPPHPRPLGAAGLAHSTSTSNINLPPIATLPPSPTDAEPRDRMQVDRDRDMGRDGRSHSRTPPQVPSSSSRGKFADMMNPSTTNGLGSGPASNSSSAVSVKGPGSAGGVDKSQLL